MRYMNAGCQGINNMIALPLGINVPRKRFRPVKTTSDLLIMMSNLTCLKGGMIDMNTLRSFPSVPLVKLGHCFKKVNVTHHVRTHVKNECYILGHVCRE